MSLVAGRAGLSPTSQRRGRGSLVLHNPAFGLDVLPAQLCPPQLSPTGHETQEASPTQAMDALYTPTTLVAIASETISLCG